MEIKNINEKKIYQYIMSDIMNNGKNFSILTNVEIGTALQISPITVRDKVIKLAKQKHLISLTNHFDENNRYFHRKLLVGTLQG